MALQNIAWNQYINYDFKKSNIIDPVIEELEKSLKSKLNFIRK
jgi:hypothetical protein